MAADDQAFAEPFRRIQPEEARTLIDGGQVTVVDVREPWEYEKDHIAGAKLMKIPGGSHGFNFETPEVFNKAVLDFLRTGAA